MPTTATNPDDGLISSHALKLPLEPRVHAHELRVARSVVDIRSPLDASEARDLGLAYLKLTGERERALAEIERLRDQRGEYEEVLVALATAIRGEALDCLVNMEKLPDELAAERRQQSEGSTQEQDRATYHQQKHSDTYRELIGAQQKIERLRLENERLSRLDRVSEFGPVLATLREMADHRLGKEGS